MVARKLRTAFQMRIGIYPGTFDPVTYGHLDIIKRGVRVVDKLVVGVAEDSGKDTLFPVEQRQAMLEQELKSLDKEITRRVEVRAFSGLLVNFAKAEGATTLIRGMRVVSDFEYEYQMACANARLMPELDTVFLTASENMQFTSSRFVKQICRLGGDVSSFVPPKVALALQDYYKAHSN
jgi:pantetheine-phosphate adenylyltransferase